MTRSTRVRRTLAMCGLATLLYVSAFQALVLHGFETRLGEWPYIVFTYGGFDADFNYRLGKGEHVLYCLFYPVYQVHRLAGCRVAHLLEPLRVEHQAP